MVTEMILVQPDHKPEAGSNHVPHIDAIHNYIIINILNHT